MRATAVPVKVDARPARRPQRMSTWDGRQTTRAPTSAAHHALNPFAANEEDDGVDDGDSAAADVAVADYYLRGPDEPELTVAAFYQRFVARTAEDIAAERAHKQRSVEWKIARKVTITASQFGRAVGHCPYGTPTDLLREKLWDTFKGNKATRWGTRSEPRACLDYTLWAQRQHGQTARVVEHNLIRYEETPWMAVSPDGILEYTDPASGKVVRRLVEFKCPFNLWRSSGTAADGDSSLHHPYRKHPMNTPPHYYDQIQGIMGYFWMEDCRRGAGGGRWDIDECDFVVWQPRTLWITRHRFDRSYFTSVLFPRLQTFYFTRLLPLVTAKYNGRVPRGATKVSSAGALRVDGLDEDDVTLALEDDGAPST